MGLDFRMLPVFDKWMGKGGGMLWEKKCKMGFSFTKKCRPRDRGISPGSEDPNAVYVFPLPAAPYRIIVESCPETSLLLNVSCEMNQRIRLFAHFD